MSAPVEARAGDRVTGALLVVSLAFGWLLFGSGPVIPRLQAEYDISRTVASLHSVAFAVGNVAAALFTVAIMRRTRRGGAIVVGLAGMAVGAVAITAGPSLGGAGLATSVVGFGLAGAAGTLVSTGTAAIVDARHGAASGGVLSAIHGTGAIAGLLAPLAIGATIAVGLTWRTGLAVHVLLAAVGIALVVPLLEDPHLREGPPAAVSGVAARGSGAGARGSGGAMPVRFWVILVVLMAGIACEFAFGVWSGDLLLERTPLGPAGSTASVSGVIAGMAVGRLLLARVAGRAGAGRVLLIASAVVAVGWVMVWSATLASVGSAWLAVTGLVVSGLGIGAFFPIGMAWLIRESLGRPEAAVARLNVGGGAASGLMPFALGFAADRVGVHTAFLLVPAVVGVAVIALLTLHGRARQQSDSRVVSWARRSVG